MRGEVVVASKDTEVPGSFHAAVGLCCEGDVRQEAIARFRAGWRAPGRLVLVTGEDSAYGDAILAWPPRPQGQGQGRFVSAAPTLAEAVRAVLGATGPGVVRSGGEREVPLPIWHTPTFRRWYAVQRAVGNRLVSARPVWSFHARSGPLFFWALHVSVHVAAENRTKDNEVVLSRPDTTNVLLYRRGASPGESLVVLVREYRSPGTAADGFVHELPGGSGGEGTTSALAVTEVWEETGFQLDPARLRHHGHRPVAATLSVHHAHLYSAELTEDELEWFRPHAGPYGVSADGELTWPELCTVDTIMARRLVDWPTLGMIAQVLFGEG
ncbi:hypothetical protein [Streptosporangium carneum]|nr:hypothetical protein [Streptosporangium carneum]